MGTGSREKQIDELTAVNTAEFVSAFGAQEPPPLRWVLTQLFTPLVRVFAGQIADYDAEVGRLGLSAASRRLADRYTLGVASLGTEHVPASGPLLLLSNHPGLTDTLALFSAIPRADLKIVAMERAFLRAMPHTSRQLVYVPEGGEGRLGVVREVARSLRAGEAVLTFPAGQIEPDPAVMPGAADALAGWSESTALFVRLVPDACVVPVLVSGVIAAPSLRHPLIRLRRSPRDRERLAATLQIFVNILSKHRWPVHPRVTFGPALEAAALAALGGPAEITAGVTEEIRKMMEEERDQRSVNSDW